MTPGAALRRLEDVAPTRRGVVLVGAAALVSHLVFTVVMPVTEGADYVTYMRVYAEMWSWTSVIPWSMLWRLPVAPALLGVPLDLAGPWGGRIAITLAFVATTILWFLVARRLGARCALAVAATIVLSPSMILLFHLYSTDAVSALGFGVLALVLVRAWERPTVPRFAVLGLVTAAMVLTRPAHQALALVLLLPLSLLGHPLGRRLAWTAALAVTLVVPCAAWTVMNGLRYDDRALSRGGGAWLPFYRAYVTDRIVDPTNGPASRELADLVRTRLLVREPYVSYGISLREFFEQPTTRYHEDLVGLTDRWIGWDDRNGLMRRAALEAIREHPGVFAEGVTRSFLMQLRMTDGAVPPSGRTPEEATDVEIDGRIVPKPSEGGTIPAASLSYWLSRPDNAFDEVWTSPTEHHVVSTDPRLLVRLDALEARLSELRLPPSHGGSASVMRWINRGARLYPTALVWILVAIAASLVRRTRPRGFVLWLAVLGAASLVATILSVPELPRFVSTYYPAFALLGLGALLAPRSLPVSGADAEHEPGDL